MEFLAAPYEALLSVRQSIQSGRSVNEAIKIYVQSSTADFSRQLGRWWWAKANSVTCSVVFKPGLQRSFVVTLERGLKGEAIFSQLNDLEEEMRLSMNDSIERHLQSLPIFLLLPLTLLIFPSFLLILIGPILSDLLGGLA